MNWTLRPAASSDVPVIVDIKLRSWPEAYAGFISEDYLTALDPEPQLAFWTKAMSDASVGLDVLLAFAGEEPVGVIAYGKAQSEKLGAACEIDMIYIRKSHWGLGIGRALTQLAITEMKMDRPVPSRLPDLGLWTFEDNIRARRIYEEMGGTLSGVTNIIDQGGMNLTEVAYHWRSFDDVKLGKN